MTQPLTPQEKALFSRYGNNNFALDAFRNSAAIPGGVMGSNFAYTSGPVLYRHQDELSGKKQELRGDYRNMAIDYRRQMSRAALHSPFNYGVPFGGSQGAIKPTPPGIVFE